MTRRYKRYSSIKCDIKWVTKNGMTLVLQMEGIHNMLYIRFKIWKIYKKSNKKYWRNFH